MVLMNNQNDIKEIRLKQVLEERYLAYSLSTIMNRALPDVRDGLKPVHRRILYAMHLLKLYPNSSYAKSSRIVGDVMGKFHPHGDASIYDALVRLAQDFLMRYPLIDGQGNFGNIDGDNAAAMRYTEARMTLVSDLILKNIQENAIDFRVTYNEEDSEPIVLPAAFPNLLANGASGIAVGMATSIPPHNIIELCEAALYLIENPDASIKELLTYIPGPDFPTGGILVEDRQSIKEAYQTGRGSFRLRAKWHKEEGSRGTYHIVVTEIPWQVQKSRLIEKIAELLLAKKIPLLDDVRDESAEDIRVVLTPKNRLVDPEILMESLFRLTDLDARIPLNMNVLSHGKIPNVLSLKQALLEWLEHRRDVLVRCSQFRFEQILQRLEILQGYLITYLNLDQIIKIIRKEDQPKSKLMTKFDLTELQAESVLNMRLRSLRKLEEFEIKKEFEMLSKEKASLKKLLSSTQKQWKTISEQIKSVKNLFLSDKILGARRTKFAERPEHDLEDLQKAMIEKEAVTIVLSEKGWIRTLKGHGFTEDSLTFKDGDRLHRAIHAETTDKLILVTDTGKFYTLAVSFLPGGRGHGEPLRVMLDIDSGQHVVSAFIAEKYDKMLISSDQAYGFIVSVSDLLATTRKGKQVMNVRSPDKLKACVPAQGDYVAIIGENRKMLLFPLNQIVKMQKGRGVKLQNYKGSTLSDICVFELSKGLSWKDSAQRIYTRSADEMSDWIGTRAHTGRMCPRGFPKSGKFTELKIV